MKYPFVFIVLLLSHEALAVEQRLIVGLAKPPYISEDKKSGFELEFIQRVFEKMGDTVNFQFVPYGRNDKMLVQPGINGMLTANRKIIRDFNKLSHPYITYQNVAVSLKDNDVTLNTLADLSAYRVAAFQNAKRLLGKKYRFATQKSPINLEIEEQKNQLDLLIFKRVDVIIIDINIFNYYREKYHPNSLGSHFNFHYIFPPNHYALAHNTPDIIKRFNVAVRQYKRTSDYKVLLNKYSIKFSKQQIKNNE